MGVLRLLLAASVVAAHAGNLWPGKLSGVAGVAAVETFFVVSGFYMALVLERTYRGRTREFLVNRALRIYPEFWAVGLATVVFHLLPGDSFWETFRGLPSAAVALLATANSAIFGSDTVMFFAMQDGTLGLGPLNASDPPLVHGLLTSQAWTLELELAFYLLAPMLVRIRSSILLTAVATALGIKYLIAGALLGLPDPWTYRFFPFELAFFLSGILLFRVTSRRLQGARPSPLPAWMTFAYVGAVFLVAPHLLRFGAHTSTFVAEYVVPLILVVSLAAIVPQLFLLTRRSRLDAKIGAYSYPVYLVHLLAIMVVERVASTGILGPAATNRAALLAIELAAIFVGAFGLVKLGNAVEVIRTRVRNRESPADSTTTVQPPSRVADPEGETRTRTQR